MHGLDRFSLKGGAGEGFFCKRKPSPANLMRKFLVILAILLIAVGVANGGARDVLVKAVNICTECIGLG